MTANLITLSRLFLLWLVVIIACFAPPAWQLVNVPLLIVMFATDGLDGYVARKYNQTSLFGALFDIAADRIVELTLWVALAYLRLIPLWVPLIFVARGILIDAIRASAAESSHSEPFAMMQTSLGRWLVAGRFMRIFYAVLKAVAFCWWMLVLPLPALAPSLWSAWGALMTGIGLALVYLSVAMCILRGLPVLVEFLQQRTANA